MDVDVVAGPTQRLRAWQAFLVKRISLTKLSLIVLWHGAMIAL